MPSLSTDLTDTFQALADPTRRAVLEQLARGPAPVSALAAPFDMALPSFLQHLKVLEKSGLIHSHKQGRIRICALQSARLRQAEDWMSAQRAMWTKRLDQLDAHLTNMKRKDAK